MKCAGLVLATALSLSAPAPVSSLTGFRKADGTIMLQWVLPGDPSVAAIRIERERLDAWQLVVTEIPGTADSFDDTTALGGADYRYWVFTRNAGGELSAGSGIEFCDCGGDHVSWSCSASAGASGGHGTAGTAVAALALWGFTLLRRRMSGVSTK